MSKKHDKHQPAPTAAEQTPSTPDAEITDGEEIEIVDKAAWIEAQKAAEELQSAREKLARAAADFDNFRKRLQKEKEDAIRYANEALLESLLPVIDNFELGLQAARQSSDVQGILTGMEMVRTQLQRFLADSGLEEVHAEGQPFDPHHHEAVERQSTPDHPEGTVLAQRRKGYKLRDRLIRPAIVVVAAPPEA